MLDTAGERPDPLRILYVEDDPGQAALARRRLQRAGMVVDVADDGPTGLAAALSGAHDLVLVDHTLPGFDGLDLVRRLRGAGAGSVPVVMVTGTGDEAVAVAAMKAGATDYLVKSPDGRYLDELPMVVERARDLADLRGATERAERRYRALFGAVADGFVLLDLDYWPCGAAELLDAAFVEVNPAAARLWGRSSASLEGLNLAESLPESGPRLAAALVAGTGGEHAVLEIPELHRLVRCRAVPLGATGAALVLSDVTEQVRMERQLAHLATVDGLTGLLNRRAFEERAEAEIARVRRYRRPVSLMLADLDRFKQVNDTFGHRAGDAVLRAVGQAVRQTTREVDVAGRYGGEEIAVLLPETPLGAARSLAERLRVALGRLAVPFEASRLTVTASIGVASDAGAGLDGLVSAADRALYAAKAAGRDQVNAGES